MRGYALIGDCHGALIVVCDEPIDRRFLGCIEPEPVL
jgi:hypothetical protein